MLKNYSRGFTILEVVMALLILSIGLLALLRAIPVGLQASGLGHDTTVAALLAQEKLEEARYSTWPPTSGTTSGSFTSPNDNFEWEMTVTSIAPTTYLREISLSVFWPADAGGPPTPGTGREKQRCVNIMTYLAKYSI